MTDNWTSTYHDQTGGMDKNKIKSMKDEVDLMSKEIDEGADEIDNFLK